jgi:hypothetical protein
LYFRRNVSQRIDLVPKKEVIKYCNYFTNANIDANIVVSVLL